MSTRVPFRVVVCAATFLAVTVSSPVGARGSVLSARFTQLATSGYDTSPVYSPDSRQIAFISYRDRGVGDIFVMNGDGSGQKCLTNDPHGSIRDGSLAWSPSGKQIIFVGEEPGTGYSDIYVVAADGVGSPVDLTNTVGIFDEDAQWSPDGSRIAFTSGGDICVMNADGGGVTTLTNDARFYDVSPAWSPTAQQIAFARLDALEQDGHIFVMNADGTGLTQLTDDPAFVDQSPLWAPHGRAISFVRGELGATASIFIISAGGGDPVNITSGIPVAGPGMWSPNGKRLAFASENRTDSTGDIYLVNPDGTGLTNLTESPSVLDYGPPSWSRNGLRLIFWSTTDGWPHGEIYAISAR
jgi:Tol biopolymer transport system component